MKSIIPIIFFTQISISCISQTKIYNCKILGIKKYPDGYVFTTFDTMSKDTIKIVSSNKKRDSNKNYLKIKKGKIYQIEGNDGKNSMGQFVDKNFAFRIKRTVVWRYGDPYKEVPVYAKNIIGLYILH